MSANEIDSFIHEEKRMPYCSFLIQQENKEPIVRLFTDHEHKMSMESNLWWVVEKEKLKEWETSSNIDLLEMINGYLVTKLSVYWNSALRHR